MRISYEDEYENNLFFLNDSIPPNVGEKIILEEEEWKVKSRIFYPEQNTVLVIVTQAMKSSKDEFVFENIKKNKNFSKVLKEERNK